MNRIVLLKMGALLAGLSAVAMPVTSTSRQLVIYEQPCWRETPPIEARVAALPAGLSEDAVGEAQLLCRLADDGSLSNCLVEKESSAGFGAAARSLQDQYRVYMPDGDLVEYEPGMLWTRFTVKWGDRPSVIANPNWLRRPTDLEVANAYPDRALRLSVEGTVMLSCEISYEGLLINCDVLAENPADYQFGRAGLQLSEYFQMTPFLPDGSCTVGARVNLPLRFSLR